MTETTPSLHDPNPHAQESFPILLLDVKDGNANLRRRAIGRLHWHADLQVMLISQGSAEVDCSGERFVLDEGEALLCNEGTPHRIMPGKRCSYASLLFPAKLLGFFAGSEMAAWCVDPYVGTSAEPYHIFDGSLAWHAAFIDELNAAISLLRQGSEPSRHYHACAHLVSAWARYVENVTPHAPSASKRLANERMRAFVDFIETHYAEHVSLSDIADAGGVSKAECGRVFRRMAHTTPYAYLTEVRIAHAIMLLHEGTLPITAIASSVGFGSPSHFSNAFKKATGISPGAYLSTLREAVSEPSDA